MTAIQNRYEFVYLFDVANGNPNGDPDAGNMPRLDPETNRGLVTDVCLKRKVRNFVALAPLKPEGYEIFVKERGILEHQQKRAWTTTCVKPDKKDDYSKLPKDDAEARKLTDWMCANFFDVRTFGAVMSTKGANCGQVRGPVQFTFAQSIDPIVPMEISITRMAATTEKDAEEKGDIRTMGRKYIVPYALYRGHGFISANLASDPRKGTGFSEEDLKLFKQALGNMFEHDRSAARGMMSARRCIAFKHTTALGNAPAHRLFDAISVVRANGTDGAPRGYADYAVTIDTLKIPAGVEVEEWI